MTIRTAKLGAAASTALILGFFINPSFEALSSGKSLVTAAHAVIGRPLTPGSVAGVARRTTRRVVRRSTIIVATLPVGCATIVINGLQTWQCGATYYQASGPSYVVVYVD